MAVALDKLPLVRFIRAWQTYCVGDVIQPVAIDREWLLAAGYVELVKPAAPVHASAPARKTKAQPSLGRAVFR